MPGSLGSLRPASQRRRPVAAIIAQHPLPRSLRADAASSLEAASAALASYHALPLARYSVAPSGSPRASLRAVSLPSKHWNDRAHPGQCANAASTCRLRQFAATPKPYGRVASSALPLRPSDSGA